MEILKDNEHLPELKQANAPEKLDPKDILDTLDQNAGILVIIGQEEGKPVEHIWRFGQKVDDEISWVDNTQEIKGMDMMM